MSIRSRADWFGGQTIRPLLAAAALAGACAGPTTNVDITKPVVGEASTNAEKGYRRGLEEKSSSNFLEATRYLEWVKNNFPYSQYAALSELALADMAFERDDFGAAATAYADFVKTHPSHPKADFAAYRVGLANYRDKPSEWFLMPPAQEKDQAPIRAALDALQRFVIAYPKSELMPEARKLMFDCRERLAAHERYVAEFYWKRGAWKGAAGRYLVLADSYGDLNNGKLRGDALWRAGEAFNKLGAAGDEREMMHRLVTEAPQDSHRDEANKRMEQIPADAPKTWNVPAEKESKAAELPSPSSAPAAATAPIEEPKQPEPKQPANSGPFSQPPPPAPGHPAPAPGQTQTGEPVPPAPTPGAPAGEVPPPR